VFGPDGTVESATCFGNVGHSVGLAEKDATGNHSSAIDGPAGCVDDGDIRARSSELLCDVPTGQTSPEANIGDDHIDPLPIVQVPESLVCVARFQNFLPRAPQRVDEIQARQNFVFYDQNGDC